MQLGIPMGAYCAPLVAGLFLFCCGRDFVVSLPDEKQASIAGAFNTASRCFDDI